MKSAAVSPVNLRIRLLRALDGLVFSLLLFGIFMLLPGLGETPLGDPGLIIMLPLAAAGHTLFHLPEKGMNQQMRELVWRTKFAFIFVLGLAPFFPWWIRRLDNVYFLIGAFSAGICFFWFLVEMISMLRELLKQCGDERLATEAKAIRHLIVYLSVLPFISVYVSFVVAYFTRPEVEWLGELERIWRHTPMLWKLTVLVPPLLTWRILWQARSRVLAAPEEQLFAVAVPGTEEILTRRTGAEVS